jgi:hypothetical protein
MTNAQEMLKNTVILSYSISGWTNRSKADVGKIESEAEKGRLSVTKKLVDSPEYKAIRDYQGSVSAWIKMYSVPAFFKDALVLVKTDVVANVEQKLNESTGRICELVEEFITAFPAQREAARTALGNMYNDKDYPTNDELRAAFGITWNWIELNVSENLPDDIRRKENAKLQNMWEDSIKEITVALRVGFKDLVDHTIDRLTVAPGEKPKTFRNSLIPNFKQFLDTFAARNVVNDIELSALVEQARALVNGIDSTDLRDDVKLRDLTARKFSELKKVVDEAVVTAGRKFDFDDK